MYYRYREFDALRQFIECEVTQLENFQPTPPFPQKTIGKIGEKGLQARKDALERYLTFLCKVGGYNLSNIADVLSSFLEVKLYSCCITYEWHLIMLVGCTPPDS